MRIAVNGDAPFVIECDGIEKSFPSPAGGPALSVLRGIRLAVAAGESLAIVGPSGAGKTTLLSVMGTLEPPSAGVVRFRGGDVSRLAPRRLARLRNREIGFIFQRHFLLPQLSLLENVLVPAMAAPGGVKPARARAVSLLERVGLGGRLSHRPAELSGGECQRAACARALINAPAVLLADEPTGSLDSASADGLSRLMVELNGETGVALVVVTHSEALAALMARTVHILDGVLRAEEA